jgi:hypothetical protein
VPLRPALEIAQVPGFRKAAALALDSELVLALNSELEIAAPAPVGLGRKRWKSW